MTIVDSPDNYAQVPANPILDGTRGLGRFAMAVECQVVDRQLNHMGWCTPLAAASIKASTTGETHRTLDGLVLDVSDLADINPYSDALRMWVVLEDGTRWPVGVFVFDDETEHRGWSQPILSYSTPDMDLLLNQQSDWPYGLPSYGSIYAAVNDILDECSIPERYRDIPAAPTEVAGNDPPIWQSGTSRHQMLDDLCKLAGWLPGYFANDGTYTIKVAPNIESTYPDHVYLPDRINAADYAISRKLLSAPNVYVVVGSGPTRGDITGIAYVDTNLPWSVERRGFKIVSVTKVQSLTSTVQAEQMAATLAAGAAVGHTVIDFNGPPDPRHDLFQTIQIDGTIYRETQWTLPLNGSLMQHSCTEGGFPNAG